MGWFKKSENSRSGATPPPGGGQDKRRAPRIPTAVISCMLGPVTDLSETGMCITAAKAPPIGVGDLVRLELQSPKDELVVVGKVKRIARKAPAGYEIGIEFESLAPEVREAVVSLAKFGSIKGRKAGAAGAGESAGAGGITAAAQVPDLYGLLGVLPSSSLEDIHQKFRQLARKLHPDLNPSPEAQSRFIELHKAYEILKNPDKRRAYDLAVRGRTAA